MSGLAFAFAWVSGGVCVPLLPISSTSALKQEAKVGKIGFIGCGMLGRSVVTALLNAGKPFHLS